MAKISLIFAIFVFIIRSSVSDYPLTAKFALVGSWKGTCVLPEQSIEWDLRFSLSYVKGETFVIQTAQKRWKGSMVASKGRPEREVDDLGFVLSFQEPFFGATTVSGFVNMTMYQTRSLSITLIPPEAAEPAFPSVFMLEKRNYPEQVHIAYGHDPTTTMTVAWSSPQSTASTVIYSEHATANVSDWTTVNGNVPKQYTVGAYVSPFFHWVGLQGLKPGTQYDYRCGDPAHGFSRMFSFRTAPLVDAHNVTIWGDSNLVGTVSGWARSWAKSRQIMTSVSLDPSDFVFSLGDMAYCHGRHDCWDNFFNDLEEYAAMKPLMVCVGNHDFNYEWIGFYSRFRMPEMFGKPWNAIKASDEVRAHYADEINGMDPGQNRDLTNDYYSFDIGPVHYIVVNSEVYSNPTISHVVEEEQTDWLRKDLAIASSPEARLKRPWIVIFMHTPMYSANVWSVYHPVEGQRVRDAWEPLFYESGVNMIWSGHMHDMERTNPISLNFTIAGDFHRPQGVVYVINGAAGQPSMGPFEYESPRNGDKRAWSQYRRHGKGFSRLEVTRERLITKFLSASGEVRNEDALYDPMWRLKMRCANERDPFKPSPDQCKLINVETAAAGLAPIMTPQGDIPKAHDFVVDDIYGGLEEQQVLGINPFFWNDASTVTQDPANYRIDNDKHVRIRYWQPIVPKTITAGYMRDIMTATDEYYEECRAVTSIHYAQNIHFSEQPQGRPACITLERHLSHMLNGEQSCAGDTNFSVRMYGTLRGPATGPVTFFVTVADGARLYIDHKLVLDALSDVSPATFSVTVDLIEHHSHVFVFEYWQAHSKFLLSVEWQYATPNATYRGPIDSMRLCQTRRTGINLDDASQPVLVRSPYNALPMVSFNGASGFLAYDPQFYDFMPGMSAIFVFRYRSPNSTLFSLHTGWGASDVIFDQGPGPFSLPSHLYGNQSGFFRTDELGIWTFIHRVNGFLDIYKNNTLFERRTMALARMEYRFLNYMGRSLNGPQGPVDVAEWILFRFELASEDAQRICNRLYAKWFTPNVPTDFASMTTLPPGAEFFDPLTQAPVSPPDPLAEIVANPGLTVPPGNGTAEFVLQEAIDDSQPKANETVSEVGQRTVDVGAREKDYIDGDIAKQYGQNNAVVVIVFVSMPLVIFLFSRRGRRVTSFFSRVGRRTDEAASAVGPAHTRARTKPRAAGDDV
eukprot:TRINITY_DN1973_c0_g1_i2.p1 TRINITY_DN1973_c0_g1~~TRINITY_DN1973_c0_g1_i2.p1  ORF type:complete len:1219 (+),score=352.16 TRINITY_DN1973_c0_g1_i2:85-3657(+)